VNDEALEELEALEDDPAAAGYVAGRMLVSECSPELQLDYERLVEVERDRGWPSGDPHPAIRAAGKALERARARRRREHEEGR
jgi:hypothetical protein